MGRSNGTFVPSYIPYLPKSVFKIAFSMLLKTYLFSFMYSLASLTKFKWALLPCLNTHSFNGNWFFK